MKDKYSEVRAEVRREARPGQRRRGHEGGRKERE
jgi:hypothetical protein